jgi:hypothetical protein
MKNRKDHIASKAADITGYTYDYCRRIRNGERENDQIMDVMIQLQIGESKLITEIQRICPIDRKTNRNDRKRCAR